MTSYFATVATLSPTSHWKCQEASGSIVDAVAAHDGAAAGSPTYRVAGPAAGIPYGVSLASGSTFTITDHADIDLGATFSIVFWLRKTTTNNNRILVKGDLATAPGYVVSHASNTLRLQNGVPASMVRQTTADTATTWEMHAFVRNGASSIYQLNGTDDTTVSSSTAMTDNNNNLVVGGDSETFEIAGIAFWKAVVLTDANIQTIYDARANPDGAQSPYLGGGFFP